MALNTVTDAVVPDSTFAQHLGSFRDGNGNLYIVAEDNNTADDIAVFKSSDGTTWTRQDTAGQPNMTNGLASIACVLDGTVLHVASCTPNYASGMDNNVDIEYHQFYTSDDGTNPDTWDNTNINVTVRSGDIGDAADIIDDQSVEIAVRSDGDIIVFGPGTRNVDMGHNYLQISFWVSTNGGTSFGTENALNTAVEDQRRPRAVIAPNDECHVAYRVDGSTVAQTVDSADAVSTRVTVGTTNFPRPTARLITWDDGGTQRILIASAVNTGYVRRMTEDGSGDITTDLTEAQVIDANPSGENSGLAWDSTNSDAYAFFASTDTDLFYDVGANGTSWGTDTEQEDATTINGVWTNFYNNTIAYVVLDGTTVKYGELAVTTPEGVFPPFRRRQLTTVRM